MAMQQLERKTELEVYTVNIEVISGHKLAAEELGDSADTYVSLKIADRCIETKTITQSSNPVFNAKYSFEFFTNPKSISFTVLGKDSSDSESESDDDTLGFAEFNLSKQFDSKSSKPWDGHLKLNHSNTKQPKGTLKVSIRAVKLEPYLLQKITAQQKETIFKQQQQIETLSNENKQLKSTMQQLQQKNGNIQPGSDVQNHEIKDLFARMPTKKGNDVCDAVQSFIGQTMGYISYIWQSILTVIYGFPVIGYYIDLFVMFVGELFRLECGSNVFKGATSSKRPPNKLLKLYEYEGSADCKMVREILTALDLDCIIYPCPGPQTYLSRYREEAKRLCGKANSLPVLIDENYGDDGPLILLNSKQIIRYLYDEYGNNVKKTRFESLRYYIASRRVSVWLYQCAYLNVWRCLPSQGNERNENSVKPNELLELWSYEASPFCIKVREVLCSLEIPYILKNVGMGSQQKRQEFQIRFGKKYPEWRQKLHLIQVPLLIDRNTEKEIFESEAIKSYLMKTYCTAQ